MTRESHGIFVRAKYTKTSCLALAVTNYIILFYCRAYCLPSIAASNSDCFLTLITLSSSTAFWASPSSNSLHQKPTGMATMVKIKASSKGNQEASS